MDRLGWCVVLLCWASLLWGQSGNSYLIMLREKADLSGMPQGANKAAKGQWVYQRLRQTADRSQAPIRQFLRENRIAHQSLFLVNALYLPRISESQLEMLRNRPEVAFVVDNTTWELEWPAHKESVLRSSGVEWNIRQIRADRVWAMGIRGEGVVIGGQDTGYDWTHPALREQYRGAQGSSTQHDYHWFDAVKEAVRKWPDGEQNPCGYDLGEPCDDHDHGTHTMGTAVGDDGAGNQIGVAPGAQWVGVRNMDQGFGSPFTYLASFQWFLAPTDVRGQWPRPELAPDVINNSWYCPFSEGCTENLRILFDQAIIHLRQAGIFVVVSAGNAGNQCATINTIPASSSAAFAVGATDRNDGIASFSARGPAWSKDSSILLKPDVSAPGQGVRSAARQSQYRRFSGTSMAGPHVAGVIALMISANPQLRGRVAELEQILYRTAIPLRGWQQCTDKQVKGFDFAYGYGRIDALSAVEAALAYRPNVENKHKPIAAFPNPVRDILQVELPTAAPLAGEWQIYDVLGRLVRAGTVAPGHSRLRLFVGQQARGLYYIRIRVGQREYTGRFLKG